MIKEKIYPTDIWEYLVHMDYMPSRQDRDELIRAGDEKRVQIWDYFFRIDPSDLGKPQKKEMAEIDEYMSAIKAKHNLQQQEIRVRINNLQTRLFQKKVKSFIYGIGSFLIAGIVYKIWGFNFNHLSSYLCVLLPAMSGMLMWFSISFVGWDEKGQIKDSWTESRVLRENRDIYLQEALERRNILREQIKALKKQIPIYPPDSCVRDWLDSDFLSLYERSVQVTALENRLVKIASDECDEKGSPLPYPNPIYVLGPGELQHPDKIPKTFSPEIKPDLHKHLSAKRSYYREDRDRFEVLYGVYYLEHILIANDMLATYGLFYDFITGRYHAEQITEQYYQDVVAIATTHEFREIPSSAEDKKMKYVEDAPTFTLSLSSGEHRTVTFVSEKYFMEIRNKINVSEDDISRISWIGRAQLDADLAAKALRSQLRLHKVVLADE